MPNRRAGQATVYIVDDDEGDRQLASRLLEKAGFAVKTFMNGATSLEQATSDLLGCALLDMRMPERDGLQVLAKLQARQILLRVVAVTGFSEIKVAV